MKLRELAVYVARKERELAPGSETLILGAFVNDFDCFVSEAVNNDEIGNREIDDDMIDIFSAAYQKWANNEEDIW